LAAVEIDSIEATMAQFAAKGSDLDKANSYLQRIGDPEIKKGSKGRCGPPKGIFCVAKLQRIQLAPWSRS